MIDKMCESSPTEHSQQSELPQAIITVGWELAETAADACAIGYNMLACKYC